MNLHTEGGICLLFGFNKRRVSNNHYRMVNQPFVSCQINLRFDVTD
jgi:hypothetical protein